MGSDKPQETKPARRAQMHEWVPAEWAIHGVVQLVESMGAHVRLTDAVILLGKAREAVADFVDGVRVVDPTDRHPPPLDYSNKGAQANQEWPPYDKDRDNPHPTAGPTEHAEAITQLENYLYKRQGGAWTPLHHAIERGLAALKMQSMKSKDDTESTAKLKANIAELRNKLQLGFERARKERDEARAELRALKEEDQPRCATHPVAVCESACEVCLEEQIDGAFRSGARSVLHPGALSDAWLDEALDRYWKRKSDSPNTQPNACQHEWRDIGASVSQCTKCGDAR